jgi:hypothetical protein
MHKGVNVKELRGKLDAEGQVLQLLLLVAPPLQVPRV